MALPLEEDLEVIGNTFGDLEETLRDGLPDGPDPDFEYDEQLVQEIADACRRWQERRQ